MIEWFGTAMSVIIALSLMQKNIKALRIINLIGAAGFSCYGFMIHSWPVIGLNSFIVLVDAYYLIEIISRREKFTYQKGMVYQSSYCQAFLDYYRDDILRFQGKKTDKDVPYCLILRNMVPVSIILYQELSKDRAEILLDYATPQYRDFKNARYFLEEIIPRDKDLHFKELITRADTRSHQKYLIRLGYKEEEDFFIWKRL